MRHFHNFVEIAESRKPGHNKLIRKYQEYGLVNRSRELTPVGVKVYTELRTIRDREHWRS